MPVGPAWLTESGDAQQCWAAFDAARRGACVDARDFAVAEGPRALLLLVDTDAGGRLIVRSHALQKAAYPAYTPTIKSEVLAPLGATLRGRSRTSNPVAQWIAEVTADLVVARFLTDGGRVGET